MKSWSNDELRKIPEADDLHISPFREDGVTYLRDVHSGRHTANEFEVTSQQVIGNPVPALRSHTKAPA
jgi:hypothetical protein